MRRPRYTQIIALVAQWIEHLTTDQKVVGSTPAERANGAPFLSAVILS